MACRICYESDESGESGESGECLHSVCNCAGSIKYVHKECIEKWQKISKATHCELCKAPYDFPWINDHDVEINCPALVWVLFGMLIAYIHAVLLHEQEYNHTSDITSIILSGLFIIAVYSVLFWLRKYVQDTCVKLALIVWPITFFTISYYFQSCSGDFGFNVWVTYGISLSCFICWGLLISLENQWCCGIPSRRLSHE